MIQFNLHYLTYFFFASSFFFDSMLGSDPVPSVQRPREAGRNDKMQASKYQTAVLDFVRKGNGHAFVSAVAGSGKTTTLKMIAEAITGKGSAAFLAFNAHIRDELATKLPQSVTVATIHQIGLRTCAAGLGKRCQVDNQDKLSKTLIDAFIDRKFAGQSLTDEDKKEIEGLRPNLKNLIRFAKVGLIDPTDRDAIQDLIDDKDLELDVSEAMGFLRSALSEYIKRARNTGEITFDDMIWLPNVLGFKPQQFQWVMVDESQDLNPAQRELTLKMIPANGRAIYVGDPRQAIYAFAGADAHSVQAIMDRTRATILPLSVCYRCPTSHIAMAQGIVPEIEAADGAPVGEVLTVAEDKITGYIGLGDLVMCRTTAPLIKLAYELIGQGKPARVKGRDIGAGLVALIDKIRRAMKIKRFEDFGAAIFDYADLQIGKLGAREGNEDKILRVQDQTESLSAVMACVNADSFEALKKGIEDIFTDSTPGIILATIHRVKGLEAENTVILHPELIPHPMAKTPEAIEQEENLRYVAFTRAKSRMILVDHPKKDKSKKGK